MEKVGIFVEFGKIVCIFVGVVYWDKVEKKFKIWFKFFVSENEVEFLQGFLQMVFKYYNDFNKFGFCGYNVKEFDIFYICCWFIINCLFLFVLFDLLGKKFWEIKYIIDMMDMWFFGDCKNFIFLKLLVVVLGFLLFKDDIDGLQVGWVYWEDKDLWCIFFYCEKDVLVIIQFYFCYKFMLLLEEDQVVYVDGED